MFRVFLNKSHCRVILKTLDIHRFVIRGEMKKISPLIIENKKPQLKYNYDIPDSFDSRMHSLFIVLEEIENIYFSRYFNVLQLMPRSVHISNIKKKLYSLLPFLNGELHDVLPISFSSDEIRVIVLSCKLYCDLLCGRVEVLEEIFEELKISLEVGEIVDILKSNRSLITNLVDENLLLDISSDYVFYKARWCYDIYNVLNGIEEKKIGSIPLLKFEEKNVPN